MISFILGGSKSEKVSTEEKPINREPRTEEISALWENVVRDFRRFLGGAYSKHKVARFLGYNNYYLLEASYVGYDIRLELWQHKCPENVYSEADHWGMSIEIEDRDRKEIYLREDHATEFSNLKNVMIFHLTNLVSEQKHSCNIKKREWRTKQEDPTSK